MNDVAYFKWIITLNTDHPMLLRHPLYHGMRCFNKLAKAI